MQRTLNTLKAAALIASILVAASVCLVLLQVSSAVKHADDAVSGTAARLNGVVDHLDVAVVRSGKLVDDARLSADNINKAAIDERFYFEKQLPLTVGKVDVILDNVQQTSAALAGTAAAATGAIDQARVDLKTADGSIAASKPLLDAATLAVTHADAATVRVKALLDSPELADDGTEIHGLLAHGNAIAGDAQFEADKFAHPKKAKLGFWSGADATVLWIHSHMIPPLF